MPLPSSSAYPSRSQHNRSNSQNYYQSSSSRTSTYLPASNAASSSNNNTTTMNNYNMSTTKSRQYAHLHSQLAQLNAHLADTENLVRMTAVQAGDMRFLGGYVGGLFMGAAKVLGEEGVQSGTAGGQGSEKKRSEVEEDEEVKKE